METIEKKIEFDSGTWKAIEEASVKIGVSQSSLIKMGSLMKCQELGMKVPKFVLVDGPLSLFSILKPELDKMDIMLADSVSKKLDKIRVTVFPVGAVDIQIDADKGCDNEKIKQI